jgi:hypothetical protein
MVLGAGQYTLAQVAMQTRVEIERGWDETSCAVTRPPLLSRSTRRLCVQAGRLVFDELTGDGVLTLQQRESG